MSTRVRPSGRAVAIGLLALLGGATADAQQAKPRWEFTVAPYAWASGLHGVVGVRDFVTDVDLSFRDLLDDLRFAMMLQLGARYDRWHGAVDAMFFSVAAERTFLRGERTRDVEFEEKEWIVHPTLGYTLVRARGVSFEVVAGARYWNLRPELSIARVGEPARSASATIAWVDATLGARWALATSQRWSFALSGNGGAGGANHSWEAMGIAAYDVSSRWKLGAGYRYLSVDYDRKDRLLDVRMNGPLLGAEYRF